jgi:hypothetical protein
MLLSLPSFNYFRGRAIDLPLLADATMLEFIIVMVQAGTLTAASRPRTAVTELPTMGMPTMVLKSVALLRLCIVQDECPGHHREPRRTSHSELHHSSIGMASRWSDGIIPEDCILQ